MASISPFEEQAIDLSNRGLEDVGELEDAYLSDLTALNLSNNILTRIPNLRNAPKLNRFDVSSNRISTLEYIEQFTELKELRASRNRIDSFVVLGNLQTLAVLDLSSNPLSTGNFPVLFPHLIELFIENCFFPSFSSFNGLLDIEKLVLDHNVICDDTPLNAPHLRELSLHSNRLNNIRFMSSLKELSKVDLSYNPITDEAFVGIQMLSLLQLKLAGTPITRIPLFAPNIELLDVSNTSVSSVEDLVNALAILKNLKELFIGNTPLSRLDCQSTLNDLCQGRELFIDGISVQNQDLNELRFLCEQLGISYSTNQLSLEELRQLYHETREAVLEELADVIGYLNGHDLFYKIPEDADLMELRELMEELEEQRKRFQWEELHRLVLYRLADGSCDELLMSNFISTKLFVPFRIEDTKFYIPQSEQIGELNGYQVYFSVTLDGSTPTIISDHMQFITEQMMESKDVTFDVFLYDCGFMVSDNGGYQTIQHFRSRFKARPIASTVLFKLRGKHAFAVISQEKLLKCARVTISSK